MTGFAHKITSNYEVFRSIFWILNFLLAVSAGGVIAIGVVKLLDVAEFNNLVEQQIAPLQIAVIVIGSIQALLSFYGFLAIIMEVHYMLYGYLGVLSLIVMKKYMLPFGWNLGIHMYNEFLDVWNNRHYTSNWEFIDLVQRQFHCCGLYGANDYVELINLPSSCCPASYDDCNPENSYAVSCRQKMLTWGIDIIDQLQLALGLMTILDVIIFLYILFVMIPVLRLKRKLEQTLEFERKLKMPKEGF